MQKPNTDGSKRDEMEEADNTKWLVKKGGKTNKGQFRKHQNKIDDSFKSKRWHSKNKISKRLLATHVSHPNKA